MERREAPPLSRGHRQIHDFVLVGVAKEGLIAIINSLSLILRGYDIDFVVSYWFRVFEIINKQLQLFLYFFR